MPKSEWKPAGRIPVPLGLEIPRTTDQDLPLLRIQLDDAEILSATAKGNWPTVIAGWRDGQRAGLAFDYNAQWHDQVYDEIAVYQDEREWWVVIEFESQTAAIRAVNYDIGGFTGYEILDSDYLESDFERFREFTDSGKTPIVPTASPASKAVYAIQQSSEYSDLEMLFDLAESQNLRNRSNQLDVEITTPASRARRNELNDIARNLTEDNPE